MLFLFVNDRRIVNGMHIQPRRPTPNSLHESKWLMIHVTVERVLVTELLTSALGGTSIIDVDLKTHSNGNDTREALPSERVNWLQRRQRDKEQVWTVINPMRTAEEKNSSEWSANTNFNTKTTS